LGSSAGASSERERGRAPATEDAFMAPSLSGEGAPPRLQVVVQCRDPLLRGLLADWLDRRAGLVAVAVVRDGGELLFSCGTYRPGLAILEADPVGWSAPRVPGRLREDGRVRS